MIPPRLRSAFAFSTLVLALAACGSDDKKPATQVAAKVNKDDISVHQINYALARSPNVTPERAPEARKQILDKLVDQQLLVQKAVDGKLDRDPNVMMTIEAARKQILAQAYMERAMAAAAKPTPQDIKKYYDEHPQLFSERRIFRLQEISVAAAGDKQQQVRDELGKAKTVPDFLQALKDQKIEYTVNSGVKAAEQLPLELLPRFHKMKDGEIGVIPSANNLLIVQLVASQTQPLDEKKAEPFIERFLTNQKRMEIAEQQMKQLRTAAAIEYVGDFARQSTAAAPAAPAASAQPAAPGAAPQAAQPAADQSAIEKGLTGLKR